MVVQAVADMSAAVHTAIIGCGNPNRSDDGLGPAVAARLRDMNLPPGAAVFDAGTDGSRDVVVGDNGFALFDADEVLIHQGRYFLIFE